MMDAIAAATLGLQIDDLRFILRDCDHTRSNFPSSLDPKGFWRIDKGKDPELRQPVLTIAAFYDLQRAIDAFEGDRGKGIEEFCSQNEGQGWMIPEALRLADFKLGRGNRAEELQPVSERLGDRFYDWQVEKPADDSWTECEHHARQLLGDKKFEELIAGESDDSKLGPETERIKEQTTQYSGSGQGSLF